MTGRWQEKAACTGMDPDVFFPFPSDGDDAPKEVCAGCPVREQCLDFALASNFEGVWGGTNEAERRRMRRLRGGRRPRPPDHGVRARYQAGCRCVECSAANSRYNVRRRVS